MKNIKETVLNLGVGTVIYIVISVLITPVITRLVSPDEYGRWSMFVMYGTLISNFLLLGTDQAFVRFFYVDETIEYRRSLLRHCVKIPFVISTGLVLIVLSLLAVLGKTTHTVLMFGIYLLSLEIGRYGISILRLEYRTKLYSLMQCADKVLLLLLTVIIVRFSRFSDSLIVAATLTSIVLIVIYCFVEKKYWFKASKAALSNKNEIFKYAIPSAVALLITSLFQATDKTVISLFCDDTEVGIYAGAMSIVNIFAIVQTIFSTLCMRMAIEHYEKKGNDDMYIKANKIITFIMVFMGMGIILFKDILIFFIGAEYRAAAEVIPFLIFIPIMYTISETTVLGIVFKKKTVYQIWVGIGALVVNLILALILVPRYGAIGASVASACAYVVFFFLRSVLAYKVYPIKYDFCSSIIAFVGLAFFSVFGSVSQSFAAKLVVFFILALILIFINKQMIIDVFNYFRRQKK